MRIAVGADHRGFALKESLAAWLRDRGYEVLDFGTRSAERADYPEFALKVARAVQEGRAGRGILVCATGIGMSIAANRIPRVRAALCCSVRLAQASRAHNNANVLCLGADVVSDRLAKRIATAWLATPFEGGRHRRRVAMVDKLR